MNASPIDLLEGRALRLATARLWPTVRYLRDHGIDVPAAEVAAGGCYVCPIVPRGRHSFSFDEAGVEGAVVEALAEDGVSVLDLVAWPLDAPARWRLYLGAAPALGMAAAVSPVTYFDGLPLQIYRSPAEWLKGACDGAVLLHPEWGVRWLLDIADIATTIAARDDRHATEIGATRRAMVERQGIVVPVTSAKAEAAA